MDVAVAGGHGKIALRLLRLLAERGDRGRGLIRNLEHAADLEEAGATPVGADLENLDPDAIARSIAGVEAIVFAAGAGPGSGPARKRTVDYGGAVKLVEAAKMNGISRYLMVSAMGVRDPAARGPEISPSFPRHTIAALRGPNIPGLSTVAMRSSIMSAWRVATYDRQSIITNISA